MSKLEFVTRLAIALLLGAAIGLERQWRQRTAGLQTNTLVSTGAALFVMLSVSISGQDSSPSRITAQVVSGIGFLGGGVILREGITIRGLNTAATLWCAAAIGSLSGWGLLFQGAMGTVAVVSANLILYPLRYYINQQPLIATEIEYCYRCHIICHPENEVHIRTLLLQIVSNDRKMRLRSLITEDLEDNSERFSVKAELISSKRNDALLEKIVSRLSLEPGVFAVSWRILEQQLD